MKKQARPTIDLLGICTSFICMIHCISIPLLIILGFDSILWLIDNEWVELGILLASLLIGGIAFFRGYLLHRQRFIPLLFVVGFLLIANGESIAPEWLGILVAVIGATLIAFAHFQNLKWRRITTMVAK